MLAVTPELFLLLVLFSLGSRDCIRISYWLFPIRSCDNQSLLLLVFGWGVWLIHLLLSTWRDAPVYAGKVHLLTPWVMSDQRVVLKFTFMCVCFFLSSQMMTSLCICLSVTPSSHLFIISEECQRSTNTPAASCLQTDGQTDAIGGLLM